MRVVKALLTVVLVLGLGAGTAYGAGMVMQRHDQRTVAGSDHPLDAPTSDPASPTGSPSPADSPAPTPSDEPATSDPQPDPKVTKVPQPKPLQPGPPLYGAGDSGSDVRALQARLKQIAWYSGDVTGSYDGATVTAVRGFQAKRVIPVTGAVDRRTLDRLDAMTTTPTHDELLNIQPSPGKLDPRCQTGRVLCIDKTSRTLRWVVDGHVVRLLDARFGSTLNDTPTREGLFHVYLMDADHVSHLYGSSMPYAMFFSGGQAVHYSSDFAAVGYEGASHGCVNIRDLDGVRWLFSQVHVGDKVVVYWS